MHALRMSVFATVVAASVRARVHRFVGRLASWSGWVGSNSMRVKRAWVLGSVGRPGRVPCGSAERGNLRAKWRRVWRGHMVWRLWASHALLRLAPQAWPRGHSRCGSRSRSPPRHPNGEVAGSRNAPHRRGRGLRRRPALRLVRPRRERGSAWGQLRDALFRADTLGASQCSGRASD